MSAAEVTRSVELDAAPDAVWDLLVDDELRSAWLDDDDAVGREVHVEHADPGRSLRWTWWHPDDPAGASQVEVVLDEGPGGNTRLVVTERMPVPVSLPASIPGPSAGSLQAEASATATATRRISAGTTWERRLLGVELLLVVAGALVA